MSCSKKEKCIICRVSQHPYSLHRRVSSTHDAPLTDQDIKKNKKNRQKQRKASTTITTAAITSHYKPPIKSFTACLGGESVAE